MAVSLTKVAQVKSLKAEGVSQRQIALRSQISRTVVARILAGKHKVQQPIEKSPVPKPNGSYVYCPGCYHNVKMPCLACYLRSRKKT